MVTDYTKKIMHLRNLTNFEVSQLSKCQLLIKQYTKKIETR